MLVSDIVKESLDKLIGKDVYFMHRDKIHHGEIGSHNSESTLYVHDERGVAKFSLTGPVCSFFYTIDEMIEHLKKTQFHV